MERIVKKDLPPQNTKESGEMFTDEEVGNLIASLGNHEAKALTLLSMKPGVAYSQTSLHHNAMEIQGGGVGWNMSNGVPFSYCTNSLAPIGLVAKELVDESKEIYGYVKTAYGQVVGDSLAGHLLSLSERHPNCSLIEMFGSTNSTSRAGRVDSSMGGVDFKNRAPNRRIEIYNALLTIELPARTTDLIDVLGGQDVWGAPHSHLHNLSESGLIQFTRREVDKSFTTFKLADDLPVEDPPPYMKPQGKGKYWKMRELTTIVYGFMQTQKSWTSKENIIRGLIEIHPDKERQIKTNRYFITSILRHLERFNYLESGDLSRKSSSEITLNAAQREILTDVTSVVRRFQYAEHDVVDEGRILARELISDPSSVAHLFNKAKMASPNANRLPRGQIHETIVSIVKDNQGASSHDIRDILNKDFGIKLQLPTISNNLKLLEREREIVLVKQGSAKYWKVP
jgi:hypothetical protein